MVVFCVGASIASAVIGYLFYFNSHSCNSHF